jgi:hypothetical protein
MVIHSEPFLCRPRHVAYAKSYSFESILNLVIGIIMGFPTTLSMNLVCLRGTSVASPHLYIYRVC